MSNTVLSSPFLNHKIVDALLLKIPAQDHKQRIALLASKIHLLEQDSKISSSLSPASTLVLAQHQFQYIQELHADGQSAMAESECTNLSRSCKDAEKHFRSTGDEKVIADLQKIRIEVLKVLEEIDGIAGKEGRVKRWREQRKVLEDGLSG